MRILINHPLARFRSWVFACLLGVLVATPTTRLLAEEPEEDHDEHEDEHAEAVLLDAEELAEFRIEVSVAGAEIIQTVLDLPGEIQVNDNQLAHIVPRFSGIVTDVRVQTGDQVQAGQILAVIESDESLSPYEIRTLIAGTIIDKHITLGEAVSREHAAFVVADLSSVWADITVYQRDLPGVSAGQHATIIAGHGMPEVSGEIIYVAPIVDETTRTALARVVLPNPEGIWRPGTFIMARIAIDQVTAVVAVPLTALQTMEASDVIFVETEEGFIPRTVTLGRADREHIEILSGLQPGERYVSKGGFTIKAELGKESLGDDHGH